MEPARRSAGPLFLLLLIPASEAFKHGWDCVSCPANSMLASDVGTFRPAFNLSDPWWIDTLADSHAVVVLLYWKRAKMPATTKESTAGATMVPELQPMSAIHFEM